MEDCPVTKPEKRPKEVNGDGLTSKSKSILEGEEEGRRVNQSKTQLAYPKVVTALLLGTAEEKKPFFYPGSLGVLAGRWEPLGAGVSVCIQPNWGLPPNYA